MTDTEENGATDPAAIIDELAAWREILRLADLAYDELPVDVQREIERRTSQDELLMQVPALTQLSIYSRQRIRRTLNGAMLLLSEWFDIPLDGLAGEQVALHAVSDDEP